MLSNKLISFGKKVSQDFVKHIESTPNLCMYKLGSHYIPDSVIFPKAESVTLINCSRNGILNVLTPRVFPNLHRVNYLSTDPGDFKIYERYNDKLKWVFPNKPYEFYDFMVKTGRGTKDPQLIKEYIASKRIIDGKNGFDISFYLDLNIPGFGITDGEWWRSQFYEYLVKKEHISDYANCLYPGEVPSHPNKTINQELEESKIEKEIVAEQLSQYDFTDVIDEE
jgi:hypothetical protein